jgi:hypothetical protein
MENPSHQLRSDGGGTLVEEEGDTGEVDVEVDFVSLFGI